MKKCISSCLWLLSGLALVVASTAGGETVSLSPSRDNTIYSESESTNGGGQHIFVGANNHAGQRRSLIAFDVASQIPAGSAIQSARVTLHMSMTNPQASEIVVSFYRLMSDWGEGTAVGLAGEGGGAAPGPGDATWSFNFFNTSRWNMPGAEGDRAQTPSATRLVPNPIDFHTWQSTPALVADVQSWLDSPETNFGWLLTGELTPASAKRFDSRENSNPQFRPLLEVVYRDGGNEDAGSGGPDAGIPPDGGPDSGIPADAGVDSGVPSGDNGPSTPHAGTSNDPATGCGCHSTSGPLMPLLGVVLLILRWRKGVPIL